MNTSATMKILVIAFCCTYIFVGANCNEQFNRVENPGQFNSEANSPVHGQVISSEKDRAVSHGPFDKLLQDLRKNFEQTLKFTFENLPKHKHASSDNQLPVTIFPRSETTDLEKNGEEEEELPLRKLNRISLATVQAREDPRLSSRDRREDQQSNERQGNADINPFKHILEFIFKKRDVEAQNYPSLPNLINFLLKNSPLEFFGLPGHPIRKLIEIFRQKMAPKQEDASDNQQADHQLIKKFFEQGKDVLDNLRKI